MTPNPMRCDLPTARRSRRMPRPSIPLVLALLVGAAVASEARAQSSSPGELSGQVVDSETGDPVSQATVVLEVESVAESDTRAAEADEPEPPVGHAADGEDGLRSVTDSEGRFLLAPVPAGSHVLRVEHLAYGEHERRLQVEGEGRGRVEVTVSPTAIALEPLVVETGASSSSERRATPSSRNTIDRESIAEAASSGLSLSDLLSREIPGIYVQRSSGIGAPPCLEFRGARRGDGRCRPPQLIIDGTSVPDPLSVFGFFSLDGVQEIRIIPPSEAGVRFGPNAGWGVVLLETGRRNSLEDFAVPVVERTPLDAVLVDWSFEEPEPYPWARVYTAAFLGNAVGLLAGSAVLRQCMDLGTQRFYRGDDYCGGGPLLASELAMAVLPVLGGSLATRYAGSTPRSRGDLGRSILHSVPVFVPGFAIVGLNSGSTGLQGTDILGLALVVLGAPALNTLSDHYFRRPR